jgi:hypothetical protein
LIGYLHRAADPVGEASFVQLLKAGVTVETVAEIMLDSPEYRGLHGGTNAGWLSGVYQDVLGRPIDPVAQATWLPLLQSGTLTRAVVADVVLHSVEYHRSLVDQAFVELLDRPADPLGEAFGTNLLNQGFTDEQLIAVIASAPEYYAKTLNAS